MSKTAHLPKTVPSKEIPLHFNEKGSTTGKVYEGSFVVTVPKVQEMSRIGVELAKLNGGIKHELLDESTAGLNNAIAFLTVVVKDGPAWWFDSEENGGVGGGMDTVDFNIPIKLFKAADKAIQGWYKSLKGQPKDDTATEE